MPKDIAEFQDRLRQDPDLPQALDWGWELTHGQESEYLNVFRDLTKTDMDVPGHVRNFARAYLRLGRPLLAVVQFQKYLNASPSSAGYRELAEVYQKLNRERNVTEANTKANELAAKGL
jgi:predicted Zn-dependent protease